MKVSGLSAFDDLSMITRMVSSVEIATAFCEQDSAVAFVGEKDRHSRVNAERVAHKFRCGLDRAQRTLKSTTQRGVRQSLHPLHCHYRVDHLDLHRKRLQDTFLGKLQ
jgi:hypothetical protein